MTTGFLTRDFTSINPPVPGGCAYYRCYLPMSVMGDNSLMGPPAWDPYRGFGVAENQNQGIFGFSSIMLKLIMDRSTPKQIELAKNLRQRIIVDIDDYYPGLTPANRAYHQTHPENNKMVNRDNYQRVIDAADTLTVSTPFLLDYHSATHADVRLVRNGVNPYQFASVQPPKKPVLGWTGSTAYRNNDLEQLREWLPDFLEEHDLDVHHTGYDPSAPSFAEVTGIPERRVTTTPLLSIPSYATGFKFSIGIVPLSDIPFNHAKSNIKGLEYVAAGIPFVATDVPEYRTLHEAGVGAIARTPEDWMAAITLLLDDKYRAKKAAAEKSLVVRDWSIEARAHEWRAVLNHSSEQTH